MQRWHDGLALLATGCAALFYLVATLALIWGVVEMSTRLVRHDREMDRAAIQHEQMMQDHINELKDHERLMQGR
jgi:hypothetical protein